jgi:hypothetical protein
MSEVSLERQFARSRRAAQTYLVRHAKPGSFRITTRGIEGVATRMIGRDSELAQLQESSGASTARAISQP